MHILPQKLSDARIGGIVCSMVYLNFCSVLVYAKDFDFAEMLGGYGEAGYGEEMRARVRSELSGREQEVWAYVKDSFFNGDGVSDVMAISAGLRALHDLNGYSEEILQQYAEILEAESHKVEQLNDVLSRTTPVPGVGSDLEFNEYHRATKALGLIRSSFFVFKTYGEGLTGETVSRLLQLNDGQVQTRVAEWYRVNGNPSDIPVLKARAAELQALGDQPGSELVSSVVEHIQSGSTGGAEAESPTARPTEAEQPLSPEESDVNGEQVESPSPSRSPVWPYVIMAVALMGIAVIV
ncbi:MAG: hypothetical protein P1U68_05400 [Verrucomicrobiales bacterium]|nr:hypothetical protein [Verrucomicrobiales bacterium]